MKYKTKNIGGCSSTEKLRRMLIDIIMEADEPQIARLYAFAYRMKKERSKKSQNKCSKIY